MSKAQDVNIAIARASELDQAAALALHDELKQLGMVGILQQKRKLDLAALGLLAGYDFKGFGCGSCLAQIERGMLSGTLREALKFTENSFKNPFKMAELKKYTPVDAMLKRVRRFTFRDKNGLRHDVAPQNMTDEFVELWEASRPEHKGRYFKPVKATAKKKTAEKEV